MIRRNLISSGLKWQQPSLGSSTTTTNKTNFHRASCRLCLHRLVSAALVAAAIAPPPYPTRDPDLAFHITTEHPSTALTYSPPLAPFHPKFDADAPIRSYHFSCATTLVFDPHKHDTVHVKISFTHLPYSGPVHPQDSSSKKAGIASCLRDWDARLSPQAASSNAAARPTTATPGNQFPADFRHPSRGAATHQQASRDANPNGGGRIVATQRRDSDYADDVSDVHPYQVHDADEYDGQQRRTDSLEFDLGSVALFQPLRPVRHIQDVGHAGLINYIAHLFDKPSNMGIAYFEPNVVTDIFEVKLHEALITLFSLEINASSTLPYCWR
ncbi:hypothetical protein OROGR_012444 [Orobanche gracilis]